MRIFKSGSEQKTVKPKVRKLLTKHGWFWWGSTANGFGQTGIADICAIKDGMFMAVETKFGRNDPTPMQMAFIYSVRAGNHFGFIVRETTVDAFATFLEYLDRSIAVAAKGKIPDATIGGPMLDAIKAMSDTEVLNLARFKREAQRAAEKRNAGTRVDDD